MKTQQRGNTIIGLIIGIVLGLGIALGIAVYVTKVPVPFVNKTQRGGTEQDEAEARRNRDWDPNAPLAGRAGTSPQTAAGTVTTVPQPPADNSATGQSTAAAPAVVPAMPATASPGAAAPVPVVVAPNPTSTPKTTAAAQPATRPVEVKPTPQPPEQTTVAAARPTASPDDPLGDLVRSRGGDPFIYYVQAGAFRDNAEAEAQRAKLSLMGVEAKVTERDQAGRTVFRVRVGPFDKRDEADRLKDRLGGGGLETNLVRVQR